MIADVLILVLATLMLAWGLLYTFVVVRRRLASMPEHRRARPILQLLVLPMLGMGLSIGLLLSTAGAAVCPSLLGVAAPLTCRGQFQVRLRGYTYAPGTEGSEASAWCVRESGGSGERITAAATLWSTLVYGGLFSGLLLLLMWLPHWSRARTHWWNARVPAVGQSHPPGPGVRDPGRRIEEVTASRRRR